MLISYVIHQHAVKETFLTYGETAVDANVNMVAAGGSPPQRGRLKLIEAPTPS